MDRISPSLRAWGLGYYEIAMLKSMLVNKDFQTWHLIGWQHSRQTEAMLENPC